MNNTCSTNWSNAVDCFAYPTTLLRRPEKPVFIYTHSDSLLAAGSNKLEDRPSCQQNISSL